VRAGLATKNVFGEPFYGPIDDGLLEGLGAKPAPPSASRTGRAIRRKVKARPALTAQISCRHCVRPSTYCPVRTLVRDVPTAIRTCGHK
jgi:hypothetical protein